MVRRCGQRRWPRSSGDPRTVVVHGGYRADRVLIMNNSRAAHGALALTRAVKEAAAALRRANTALNSLDGKLTTPSS